MARKKIALIGGAAAVLCASVLPFVTLAQDAADWISGFPREPVPVEYPLSLSAL